MANHENAIDARATFITLMLREDHQKLKELFDQFGKTTNKSEKRNIVTAAIAALEVHATLEEELIYPVEGTRGRAESDGRGSRRAPCRSHADRRAQENGS